MPWSYYRTVALIHKHKVKAGGVSLFYFSIFKGRQVIFLHLLICLFNISFTEVGKSFFQLHILLSLFDIFYSLQFLCKSFLQLLLRFEYLRHCPFSNPWFLLSRDNKEHGVGLTRNTWVFILRRYKWHIHAGSWSLVNCWWEGSTLPYKGCS